MKRKGFTLIELMVVILVIGLLIAILGPALGEAMESGRRVACLNNLKAFGTALNIYKSNNNQVMPMLGRGQDAAGNTTTADTIDTQNALWLLVCAGQASPEAMICPSDKNKNPTTVLAYVKFSDTVGRDPTVAFPMVDGNGMYLVGGDRRCWSYSYQIPNGHKGSPAADNQNAAKFAIMSDRAPWSSGAAGTGVLKLLTDEDTVAKAVATLTGTADKTVYNSPNHGGAGQNVLFQDGHATWNGTPWCGIDSDNIFTVQSNVGATQTVADRIKGTAPVVTSTDAANNPASDNDSVLCNINKGRACLSGDQDGYATTTK